MMIDARSTAVEPSHHHGFFRLYAVDDRIRPWRIDDGTENGWKANVAWVDVEPDIRISIEKHERMPWLYGDAEVLVTEAACCSPHGYASIARPYEPDESDATAEWNARFCGANPKNDAIDWLTSILPASRAADLVFVRGLLIDERLMVVRLNERAREWIVGKFTPCGNFGCAFVYFSDADEATKLKAQAQGYGLHVAESNIATYFRKAD